MNLQKTRNESLLTKLELRERLGANETKRRKKKLMKMLATAEAVGRKIPGCKHLIYRYKEYWNPMWDYLDENEENECIEEVKNDIKRSVAIWIKKTSENEIIPIIDKLHPVTRKALSNIMTLRYQNFFRFEFIEIPNELAAPTPFLCINRNLGNWITLTSPLILNYGSTEIVIKGVGLCSYDGKVTMASLQLRKKKKCNITKKNISYITSLVEIAKTLQKSNPWSETVLDAIWNSLERLRGVVITITNSNGNRQLGGIIDGATELEEDNYRHLEIFLDRTLITMLEEGCASLDPDIYFNLSPKATNLYQFLQRQKSFNRKGTLSNISIEKIYKYSGLGGFNRVHVPLSVIRYELRQTLDKLIEVGVVKKYEIKNNLVIIVANSIKKNQPGSNVNEENTIYSKGRKDKTIHSCPYGHSFGIDYRKFEECGGCVKEDDCYHEKFEVY